MARHPAAFINALSEEGSKREIIKYIQETQGSLGRDITIEGDIIDWTRSDLIYELQSLWDMYMDETRHSFVGDSDHEKDDRIL